MVAAGDLVRRVPGLCVASGVAGGTRSDAKNKHTGAKTTASHDATRRAAVRPPSPQGARVPSRSVVAHPPSFLVDVTSTVNLAVVDVASTADEATAKSASTTDKATSKADQATAKGTSTADEAMAKGASAADESVAEVMSAADKATDKGTSTADEAVAKGASPSRPRQTRP